MVSISMFLKSGVKLSHFMSNFPSNFKNMWRLFYRPTASCSRKSGTHFQHNFSLRFFNYKIWNKHFSNICKQISSHINIKSIGVSAFHSIFIIFSYSASKCFKNPFKYFHAIVRYFKNCMIIGVNIACTSGFAFMVTDEKTPLSVNESSQISQIQRSDFGQIIRFKFGHNKSLVKYNGSINEGNINNHTKRLNEKTRKGCDSLIFSVKEKREIRRGFPAIEIWSVGTAKPKVTECLNESARLLAQNLAQTMDEVTRDVLASTISVVQCENGINGATPTELTKADTDAVVKQLLGNDAQMISEVIKASTGIGTVPTRPAFWGFMDTDLLDDLEAVASFVNSSNYASQQPVLDAEWGSTGNIRWLYTSVGKVSGATPAVYSNFIVGRVFADLKSDLIDLELSAA